MAAPSLLLSVPPLVHQAVAHALAADASSTAAAAYRAVLAARASCRAMRDACDASAPASAWDVLLARPDCPAPPRAAGELSARRRAALLLDATCQRCLDRRRRAARTHVYAAFALRLCTPCFVAASVSRHVLLHTYGVDGARLHGLPRHRERHDEEADGGGQRYLVRDVQAALGCTLQQHQAQRLRAARTSICAAMRMTPAELLAACPSSFGCLEDYTCDADEGLRLVHADMTSRRCAQFLEDAFPGEGWTLGQAADGCPDFDALVARALDSPGRAPDFPSLCLSRMRRDLHMHRQRLRVRSCARMLQRVGAHEREEKEARARLDAAAAQLDGGLSLDEPSLRALDEDCRRAMEDALALRDACRLPLLVCGVRTDHWLVHPARLEPAAGLLRLLTEATSSSSCPVCHRTFAAASAASRHAFDRHMRPLLVPQHRWARARRAEGVTGV